ncbi:MAG: 30S ribosomal protein S15 [Candidatus Thermoplasmatota archaeon]
MARIHARRKGKSGSSHPSDRKGHPEWSALKPREVESRVLELADGGHSTSEIGIILRDQYAIPNVKVATGKKISKILEQNNKKPDIPEDLKNLIQRALKIREHMEKHNKDTNNKRNLQLTESKIRRLTRYYREQGELPKDWKYSAKQAKLMFE